MFGSRYATLGGLAGVTAEAFKQSGPVAPDSIDLWPALRAGTESPRTELVININGNWSGGLRIGNWKLLRGHPNEAFRGTDTWSTATPWADTTRKQPRCDGDACPCAARPCLFEVGGGIVSRRDIARSSTPVLLPKMTAIRRGQDPEERHDMSATHAAKLQEMLARWDELQKTEVTIEESGLCPQHAGINQGNADVRGGGPLPAGWPDSSKPDGCEANLASGHWQPWM